MCDMEAAPEEIPEQLDQCKALHAYYHAAVCDACDLNIMGTRWKCLQCPDYDLCAVCERKAHERHPAHHVFIELPRPLPESGWHVAFPLPELFDAHSVKERAQVHVGCFCIRCKNPIHGARWVCVNCIDMYQLCAKCHDLGPDDSPTSAGRHFNARNHVFAKLRFAPDRQTPRFHSLTSAGMSFDANSSSADEDVDVHVGLEVDPMLFVTPLSNDELVASGRVVLPHVHSTVPGDLEFPLLPVPWTGANAIDDARVQSQLARSSELRRSLSESNGHPKVPYPCVTDTHYLTRVRRRAGVTRTTWSSNCVPWWPTMLATSWWLSTSLFQALTKHALSQPCCAVPTAFCLCARCLKRRTRAPHLLAMSQCASWTVWRGGMSK